MEQPQTGQILLSIVTPTYNRAYTLPACFRSLESQTDRRFEWILVDDGSADETPELAESFRGADFPFTYLRQENGG